MKILKPLFIVTFILQVALVSSQNNDSKPLSLNESDLNDQFEYVIQKSGPYKDEYGRIYRVVRRNWLVDLKTHTLDSVNTLKTTIKKANQNILKLESEINNLKTTLTNEKTNLETAIKNKDEISFFGAKLGIALFKGILYTIIGILILVSLILLYKFNRSNTITRSAKASLLHLETEYEEHRRIALEREQKVRRQLQDEINKNKDKKI